MAQLGLTAYAGSHAELLDSLAWLTRPGEKRDRQVHAGRVLFTGDAAEEIHRLAAKASAEGPAAETAVHRR